jgi:hypothetical protein
MKVRIVPLIAAALLASAGPALAWGQKGHTLVNQLAAAGFAGRMPAFVTAPQAQFEIGYLGPELDRMRGSGKSWDAEYDPGHFIDLLDNGTVADAVSLTHLPRNREEYDTYLRDAGTDQYRAGYLPYAILDGWEQLREDFAYWRADDYVARRGKTAQLRADYARIRNLDQQIVLRDLGEWGHFIADASQPLHVTVHYNGWGRYPNPNGYTESPKTHSMFESIFVNQHVSKARVAAFIRPASSFAKPNTLLTQEQMLGSIAGYLQTSANTVPKLYAIEKAGGFANASPQAVDFTASRLAAGAMELRDLSVLAWQDSLYSSVGYPAISVRDILAGKAAWPGRSEKD